MKLVEDGKLRLLDKVTQYLPEFQGGKSDITLKHLLTHFSGLRPGLLCLASQCRSRILPMSHARRRLANAPIRRAGSSVA